MNNHKPMLTVTLLMLAATAAAQAPTQPAEPAAVVAPSEQPAAADAQRMVVTVVSVEGVAHKMVSGSDQWTPLVAGDELDELTVIRTGMRTKVVLRMADRGEVVLDRSTKIGVGEFRQQSGGLVRTRLGLKYGAMRATVDSSRGANDVQISTPVATLSVRGTEGDIGYSSDRGLGLRGRDGTWRLAVGPRTRNVRAGERGNNQLTHSFEIIKRQREIVLGDVSGGLSSDEIESIVNNPAPANPTEPTNAGLAAPNAPVPVIDPLPDDHPVP